jgi:hypothetical protein
MTDQPMSSVSLIHRSELLPALRAILQLRQRSEKRPIVQVAGVKGGEHASEVALALADLLRGNILGDVRLLKSDGEGAVAQPPDPEPAASAPKPPPRRRSAKAQNAAPADVVPRTVETVAVVEEDPTDGLLILDTPPILTSLATSAVAGQVDAIILVISAEKSASHDIAEAIDVARASGGELLGLILTDRRYRVPGWLAALLGLAHARPAQA